MKIEMHLHTSEVSPCGKVPAREMIRMYKEAGYSTVVVTDHLFPSLHTLSEGATAAEKAQIWLQGYRTAKDEGDKLGLTVLLGAEGRLTEYGNEDFLVYGLKEADIEWMFAMLDSVHSIAEMSKAIRERGLFLVQAHPFRPTLRAQEQSLLDGVEAFNGNPRHNSSNHLAREHALGGGLALISGSDAHQVVDVARGGMDVPVQICTNEELLAYLREGAPRTGGDFDDIAIVSEPIA